MERKRSSRRTAAMLPLVALFAACGAAQAPTPAAAAAGGPDFADAHVERMLVDSCYPCHSNERSDPWYGRLAPSSWSGRGRARLNFDEWRSYDPATRSAQMAAIAAVVRDGSMPLKDYTFFRPATKLDDAQREEIVRWANAGATMAQGGEGASR